MKKKAILMILDGWGIGDGSKADVIAQTPTPNIDQITAENPHSFLKASGEDVGLPDGQMGNSEVGHLNIGAGRVVYQDLVKINKACEDGSIYKNKEIIKAFETAKNNGVNIHFMGLVSTGGVHSSMAHLTKLTEISKTYGIDHTFVHCFMDGRDTDPFSGKGFVDQLQQEMQHTTGKIASVIGRFYAMDRDKRWDRVKVAYDLLVEGKGTPTTDVLASLQTSYDDGVTDEFIKPMVCVDEKGQAIGRIKENDVVIFFNYRNDRAKELTQVLTQQDTEGMHTLPLHFFSMTPYDSSFQGVNIIFNKENVTNTLAETISKQGLKQLHTAETEKYAHVTFFLNGGKEDPFQGEDRMLVNSPKVATYDLQPEMSALELTEKLDQAVASEQYDFIVVNYANGDMVGHTGVYEAIAKAVKTVDSCVGRIIKTAKAHDYEAIIIADHGNADFALNANGTPNTAHSLNVVPCIYVTDHKASKLNNGRLADVAPTLLKIMKIDQPKEMTGHNLINP